MSARDRFSTRVNAQAPRAARPSRRQLLKAGAGLALTAAMVPLARRTPRTEPARREESTALAGPRPLWIGHF
jgi:hypothetical protein